MTRLMELQRPQPAAGRSYWEEIWEEMLLLYRFGSCYYWNNNSAAQWAASTRRGLRQRSRVRDAADAEDKSRGAAKSEDKSRGAAEVNEKASLGFFHPSAIHHRAFHRIFNSKSRVTWCCCPSQQEGILGFPPSTRHPPPRLSPDLQLKVPRKPTATSGAEMNSIVAAEVKKKLCVVLLTSKTSHVVLEELHGTSTYLQLLVKKRGAEGKELLGGAAGRRRCLCTLKETMIPPRMGAAWVPRPGGG
ncbi:unnamed protein product [Closterium sp. Yama58-4]|nr:unnamed protein product [Closterium sp. Yama58-4]